MCWREEKSGSFLRRFLSLGDPCGLRWWGHLPGVYHFPQAVTGVIHRSICLYSNQRLTVKLSQPHPKFEIPRSIPRHDPDIRERQRLRTYIIHLVAD